MSTDFLARLADRYDGADDETNLLRAELLARCPTPLDLACRFDRATIRTPALVLLAARLVTAITARSGRLLVSMPPQEGKTTLHRWAVIWLLVQDPDRRIVYASYAHELARTSGRAVRNLIKTYGEDLGLEIADDHADASDWSLRGHRGGMFTTGVGGALTGKPADVLIVDDPIKNRQDADSEAVRRTLHDWWAEVARSRLAAGAPVLVVATRWHEDDLTGRRLSEGWPLVNVPALADGETPDALGRPAGVYLDSARGRSVADWEQTRADVGERGWAALYQGRPAPTEGGIFQRSWIDQHRVDRAPELERIEIAVDPADTGQGDAAGILVCGRAADGHAYVLADLSDQLSRAQWARRVSLAAVRWAAAAIVTERNLGMQTAVGEAWSIIRRQAVALAAAPNGKSDRVAGALAALQAQGDPVAADAEQLREVLPLLEDVLCRPDGAPCRTVPITAKANKQVRAEAVTVFYETGRAHHVGRLAQLEHEMVTWQPGQPSPNRLDTLAHALEHLNRSRPRPMTVHRGGGARVPTRTGESKIARGRPSSR